MGMQEGTVVRWLKHAGERVQADDDLVEIEAAKTNQTVTSPSAGVLERVLVAEGETVAVRTPLAILADAAAQAAPVDARRAPVTPVARKLARDLGVDLAQVTGSGPGGRIDEGDVRAFAARSAPVSAPSTPAASGAPSSPLASPALAGEPLSPMRRAIARSMHTSLQTMAQLTLFTEFDATELVRLRERLRRDFALSVTDLIVYAVARALAAHPRLNATLEGDRVRVHQGVHIGLAVALEDGLIVPVIRDANAKSLAAIAAEARALAEAARAGQLMPEQVTGSTFSVTNLGRFGIDGFTPIVNPPEAAILGVGRIIEKPAAYRGGVALRHRLTLSLTHDHRLVDGAPAAMFLQRVVEMLELPYFLGSGEGC
jgi:pyruvate dehydrogenase E2 component (dihydrolipoamide acetyltransferase)